MSVKLPHKMALGVHLMPPHDLIALNLWKQPQKLAGLFSVPLLGEGAGWAPLSMAGWLGS